MLVALFAAPASAQMPGGAPQSPPGALHRYYSASSNTHWVTPTPVSGDFTYEQTLGFLHTAPAPGRVAIYGCRSGGADYFLSGDASCEGTTGVGTYGWMDSSRVDSLSVAVYRCVQPGIGHFASLDAGCEGQTSEGRLGYTRARQNTLVRYFGGGGHWVTTGGVGAGFSMEFVLGFMLDAPAADRRAIYECANGSDRFLSADAGCEGRSELGLSGYLYTSQPAGVDVVPVYRCVAFDHFASNDSNCEGQTSEGLLGYARRTQDQLQRYYNASTNTHWVTSGFVTPGWFHEFSLGYLLKRSGDDRVALYGCLAGTADHFLSLDGNCEGQTSQGQEGWVYTNAGTPVYRCLRPGIGHFASGDANCEGTTTEQKLGGLRGDVEPPPPPLRLTCAPSDAKVSAALKGKKVRRVRYGGSYVMSGKVRNADGSPVAGAVVSILIGDKKPVVFGTATAGPRGGYKFRVKPGKNRILHAGFRPRANASDLACSRRVRLNVRAGLTLKASPKRVRFGGRVRFNGRLKGKPIPKVGKLIDLQAFDDGRWQTFQTVRANRKGRYKARYRFKHTTSPRTFRFRARARREARYPYALGNSKVVRVRVR